MKPLMLHGHERAITLIKYNREGDLLFSCAKDHTPNVWYSLNGERLGSFNGHNGAVWCIDPNWDTTRVVTGAADNFCKIWDCETGKALVSIETQTAVRTCGWSYSGNEIMYTTDKSMGRQCELHIVDSRMNVETEGDAILIPITDYSKITSALWAHLGDTIVSGHETGDIVLWDLKMEEERKSVREHKSQINDMQFNKDQTMIITASKDATAKLFDLDTLDLLKTYKTGRPVNSAAISPIRDHVVLGGGQEAMEVTTTSTRVGKFDARFFHLVLTEEFGRVKDHFGPINSVAFHPDGKSFYMSPKAPRNFSWVEDGQIAAFGWPKTIDNVRYLLSQGIRHIVTLSPETAPPVERFPEVVWTEIKVEEFYSPTTAQAQVFIEACRKAFSANEVIGVHCWWGRGRTGTMLACYYVYFHGMTSKDAVSLVRRKRPMSIETHSQEQFVHEYYIFYLQNRPQDRPLNS